MSMPHEECHFCRQMVKAREWNIEQHEAAITLAREEITEITRGMRHTAHHEELIQEEK